MPEFALVFRSRSDLEPEQVARRGADVRAWAIALRERGTLRDAVLFAPEGLSFAHERAPQPIDHAGSVSGVTVIQAPDHEAAVAIASSFAGLPYGTTVELRALVPLPIAPPPTRG
jgi:hypothetical protein